MALKTLFDPKVNEELKQEFMDELLIMSQVSHPNIVTFYGASLKPPTLCFVMELCECSLFDLLHDSRTDAFTSHQRVSFCYQISKGMEYLHSTTRPAIIHRDIKSANVLVGEGGKVLKLCDFGLVRTRNASAGTPNYMAPELLLNSTFSKAVDTYAFAILMWEIFSQELPFRGYDVEDIKRNVVRGERPEVPTLDVPAECQEIMKRGWSHDPSERPSFKEISFKLSKALAKIPRISELAKLEAMDFGADELDSLTALTLG